MKVLQGQEQNGIKTKFTSNNKIPCSGRLGHINKIPVKGTILILPTFEFMNHLLSYLKISGWKEKEFLPYKKIDWEM